MKKITLLFFLISLYSCSFQYDALKGNYEPGEKTYFSSLSYDTIWDKTLEFFSRNEIPLQVSDKGKGIIFSETAYFTQNYTQEDGGGTLKNPDAYIVCNRLHKGKKNDFSPDMITGNYNIHLIKNGHKTKITVELVNLSAVKSVKGTNNDGAYVNKNTISFYTKSTGVVEKKIAENLQ